VSRPLLSTIFLPNCKKFFFFFGLSQIFFSRCGGTTPAPACRAILACRGAGRRRAAPVAAASSVENGGQIQPCEAANLATKKKKKGHQMVRNAERLAGLPIGAGILESTHL